MPVKRKAPSSYSARFKRARALGTATRGSRSLALRTANRVVSMARTAKLNQKVNNLYRLIETKECTRNSTINAAISHNNLIVVQDNAGGVLNMFNLPQGTGDPMAAATGNRIGDQICLKGVLVKGFVENPLGRPKTFFRVMVLRGAKGETFDRSTIFKNSCSNKMLDQVNTERFSVLAQKIFTVEATNVAASGVEAGGAPIIAQAGGIGSRTFKMWIPGVKFGRGGNVQFESGANAQVKFYDYRIVIACYDWYGTPQDVNTVGRLNEMYTKLYFKDA